MDKAPKVNAAVVVKVVKPSDKTTRALRDIIADAQERADQQPRKPRKPSGKPQRIIDERHH